MRDDEDARTSCHRKRRYFNAKPEHRETVHEFLSPPVGFALDVLGLQRLARATSATQRAGDHTHQQLFSQGTEGARRESADAVIRSMKEALAAGADLHEADADGNSAFPTVLLFASQDSRGEQANPIVQYLIGGDRCQC